MHLADRAAHEAAFLRGDEHRWPERAAADRDAVVEGTGASSWARCGLTTRAAAAGIREAAGVEQPASARAPCIPGSCSWRHSQHRFGRLVQPQADHRRRGAHVVDGDAHVGQLPALRGSRASRLPRSRRSRAAVLISMRSAAQRRSISTSRLPEPTTPTRRARSGSGRLPPVN
jgi:hypothetical protein